MRSLVYALADPRFAVLGSALCVRYDAVGVVAFDFSTSAGARRTALHYLPNTAYEARWNAR